MRKSITATGLVVACAAMAIPAVTVQAAPQAPAAGNTMITMKVTGCEGCTITPVRAIAGEDAVWSGTAVKVKGGKAVLTVPTAKTRGMSFNLEASWNVAINAMPVIVTQYEGTQPGQVVTKRQAMGLASATGCWAGTTEPAVTVRVTVRRVTMPAFPPGGKKKTTQVPLAWMVPTQSATGGFDTASKGVIAQQNAWFCPDA